MLPPLSALLGLLCCGVMVFFSTILTAQTISPISAFSSEYNIGGALSGDQTFPSVSAGPEGGILTWQDNRIDGANGTGIAAVRLDGNLNQAGPVFRVNDKLAGDQQNPSAVRLTGGNSLLVWQSKYKAGQQIYARVVDGNGGFLGKSIQVSPSGSTNVVRYRTNWFSWIRTRYQSRPYRMTDRIIVLREASGHSAAAALPDGGAVVVYHSTRKHQTNSWALSRSVEMRGEITHTNDHLTPTQVSLDRMQDVYLQRLSASGQKVGPELLVNEYADFNQRTPAVAVLANGNIVVAWVCEKPRSSNPNDNFLLQLCARIFNGQGEPLGAEFPVKASDDLVCANPAVAALANGGFVVAWSQQEGALDPLSLGQAWDVYARTFDSAGTAIASPSMVNVHTAGNQFAPKLAASGDIVLAVWTSVGQDGSKEGVYGRQLAAGVPSGEEFPVNTTTQGSQKYPAVTADGQGRFLTVWSSYVGATGFDLFAQQWR